VSILLTAQIADNGDPATERKMRVQDLSEYLRSWRTRHSLTQATAAKELGIVLTTYRGLEQGRPTPYAHAISLAVKHWEKANGPPRAGEKVASEGDCTPALTFEQYQRNCLAYAYDIEAAHLQSAWFKAEDELRKTRKQLEKKVATTKAAYDRQMAVIGARYAESRKMRDLYEAFLKTGDDNPYDTEPMRSKYVKYVQKALADVEHYAKKASKKTKKEGVVGEA
jgi:DNA-binding XRE family transcriptional regulator